MTVNDGHFYSDFKKGSLLWSDPKNLNSSTSAHNVGYAPIFHFESEPDVDRLSVEHSVDLLVCPAEHLLIEVPEVNHEKDCYDTEGYLSSLFAKFAHIAFTPF